MARGTKALAKQLLPFPSMFSFDINGSGDPHEIGEQIHELMTSLNVRWKYRPDLIAGVGFTEKNVWSRSARRNRVRDMEVDEADSEDHGPALAIKITAQSSDETHDAVIINIRWLIGQDSVLFESFCGMVKREISKIN